MRDDAHARVGMWHPSSFVWFIRLKNARGFAPGFSEASVRCPMVLADGFPKGVYSSRLEKRSQALLTTQVRQGISRLRCANGASGP
jgi:hypothetical protein